MTRSIRSRRKYLIAVVALLCRWAGQPASGQTPAAGPMRLTVVGQSGGVIVGASVILTRTDQAAGGAPHPAITTVENGVAIIPGLAPGRYTIRVEFPGFE